MDVTKTVRFSLTRRLMMLSLASASALMLLGAGEGFAQKAPTGPIEITSGTSPGGTPDVLMRRAAKILNDEKIITNPLVVQNRTGGSWMVAANWVLNKKGAEKTGHSLSHHPPTP